MKPESAIAKSAFTLAGLVRRAAGVALGTGEGVGGGFKNWFDRLPSGEGATLGRHRVHDVQLDQSSRLSCQGDGERFPLSFGERVGGKADNFSPANRFACAAFSLVEVLVVVTLLSVIVLALMAVFSSTQRAFRASVTQSDVLAGGRATVDMIATDLRGMVPSGGASNIVNGNIQCPVNFAVLANSSYTPLTQNLPGSSSPAVMRTNHLNFFFVLGRENTKWTGTGYVVVATNTSHLYPLYRFYAETNVAYSPQLLYNQFIYELTYAQWTNMSHVLDGVVQLTVHAYDTNGTWINNPDSPYYYTNADNTLLFPAPDNELQLFMFSNTVPAAVQLEIGVLEDRALARAQSLSIPGQFPWQATAQWKYLQNQAGAVHLFRQRVSIPNVDPSAYQ